MARTAKKEKALTPEEKLAQALVPDMEQPYRVPKNWCWTKIGELSSLHRGVTYKKDDAHVQKHKSDCLVMRGGNIGEGYIDVDADNVYVNINLVNKDQLVKKNDIVIVTSTGSTKVIGRAGISYADYSDVAFGAFLMLVRPSKKSIPRYMDFYFQSDLYRNRIRSLASGVNINNIRSEYITESPFPLAPLAEQQRIVDRIESLFAKLDEAKEKAQAVVDGFEDRRAAILHRAFTGELTAEWRKVNGIGRDSWSIKSVDSICHSLKYGTAKKSEATGPVVVIRMGNLQQGEIDWTDLAFTTDEDDIEKYRLEPNDVLFNRTNSAALVGKTSIYRGEYPAIYAGYLIKLDYDHSVITGDYLNYALNTQDAKEYCNTVKTDGVNQSNINAKKIGAYRFHVPSIKEQEKIVEILKKLLEREKQAKETAEQVIDQIDTMKKSILARAFRGELGTNDPADESAVELLKRVL